MYKNIKKRKYCSARTPCGCNFELRLQIENLSFAKKYKSHVQKDI